MDLNGLYERNLNADKSSHSGARASVKVDGDVSE